VDHETVVSDGINGSGFRSWLTKHPDWSHEEEWRGIRTGGVGKAYHFPEAIQKVLLGPRVSSDVEEKVCNIAQSIGFNVSRINVSRKGFEEIDIFRANHKRGNQVVIRLVNEGPATARLVNAVGRRGIDQIRKIISRFCYRGRITSFSSDRKKGRLYVQVWRALNDGSESMISLWFGFDGKKLNQHYGLLSS
jgi:hypothetical protein